MRTITSGPLTIQCFDAAVWKQERNLVHISHTNTSESEYRVRMTLNGVTLGTYTLDANRKADVDVSDILRAYNSGTLVFKCLNNNETISVPFGVVGLINPASVILPKSCKFPSFVVAPPSRMLQSIGGATFEARISVDADYNDGTGTRSVTTSNNVAANAEKIDINVEQNPAGRILITKQRCGKLYADVRWVSFTGTTRRHTFEVVSVNSSTNDAVELLTIDGSYRTIKGRADGFSLVLDNLNAYDFWYYSDLIHSSSVEVSLDGSEFSRVDVTTSSQTYQEGDASFSKLEISVNYKKYDAAAM